MLQNSGGLEDNRAAKVDAMKTLAAVYWEMGSPEQAKELEAELEAKLQKEGERIFGNE